MRSNLNPSHSHSLLPYISHTMSTCTPSCAASHTILLDNHCNSPPPTTRNPHHTASDCRQTLTMTLSQPLLLPLTLIDSADTHGCTLAPNTHPHTHRRSSHCTKHYDFHVPFPLNPSSHSLFPLHGSPLQLGHSAHVAP